MKRRPLVLALALIAVVVLAWVQAEEIFSDGFESRDVCRWSTAEPTPVCWPTATPTPYLATAPGSRMGAR